MNKNPYIVDYSLKYYPIKSANGPARVETKEDLKVY